MLIILSIILSQLSLAHFAELFGASSHTSALANQFTADPKDAANNYYAPAYMAFAKRPQVEVTGNYTKTFFHPIDNVQIRNTVNSEENLVGRVDTDYPSTLTNSYHFLLPILSENGQKFGVSVFAPATSFQESSTGDPLAPEYVMYRSRYKRTVVHANLAIPLKQDLAISFGLYTGMQIAGETEIAARYNGSGKPSTGKVKAKAKPSVSPIISMVKNTDNWTTYLTYQHQMKNKMSFHSVGSTRDTILNFPYDFQMDSMVYYDPSLLRLGFAQHLKQSKIIASLEYQRWSGYKTSVLSISQNSGFIVSSIDYEQVKTRDILIPKLGYEWSWNEKIKTMVGLGYRPTPIKGDFSGAGNSIDTDAWIFSGGISHNYSLFGFKGDLGSALQVYHLEDRNIKKSDGMENLSAGNKIGAPGYRIGGEVINLSLSASVEF